MPIDKSCRKPPVRRWLSAFLLAHTAAVSTSESQVVTEPVSTTWVILEPDADSEAIGAVSLAVQISSNYKDFWSDSFTGSGCLVGLFKVADQQYLAVGSGHEVRVTSRVQGAEHDGAFIKWNGVAENGHVSGEVIVFMPGTQLSAEEIRIRRLKDQSAANAKLVQVNGMPANAIEVELLKRLADQKNAMLPAVGRSIVFSFRSTTAKDRHESDAMDFKFPDRAHPAAFPNP